MALLFHLSRIFQAKGEEEQNAEHRRNRFRAHDHYTLS